MSNNPEATTAPIVTVFGATGRLGSEIVKNLLARGQDTFHVKAAIRNEEKAKRVFSEIAGSEHVQIVNADVCQPESIAKAIAGAKYVLVASGGLAPLGLLNRKDAPYKVDYEGVKNIVDAIKAIPANQEAPKMVLCSSVGVTRPWWPVAIMINTFSGNAMKWKKESDEYVRRSGIRYAIIRPVRLLGEGAGAAGAKAKAPASLDDGGAKLVLDQGDKITGEIQRKDVAMVIVEAALSPATDGKTIDVAASEKKLSDTSTEVRRANLDQLFAQLKTDK